MLAFHQRCNRTAMFPNRIASPFPIESQPKRLSRGNPTHTCTSPSLRDSNSRHKHHSNHCRERTKETTHTCIYIQIHKTNRENKETDDKARQDSIEHRGGRERKEKEKKKQNHIPAMNTHVGIRQGLSECQSLILLQRPVMRIRNNQNACFDLFARHCRRRRLHCRALGHYS